MDVHLFKPTSFADEYTITDLTSLPTQVNLNDQVLLTNVTCTDESVNDIYAVCGSDSQPYTLSGCSTVVESDSPTLMCLDYTCQAGQLKSDPNPTTTERGDTPETTCCEVIPEPITGCTDETANNFSELSTEDTAPSSCQYNCLFQGELPTGYGDLVKGYIHNLLEV